jgi:hypothetical protein
MANWRLVLNAVCLPVLAYGSQLWYLTGVARGLIQMVQRVQNDMVRQVTGAFCMAPWEPLLHFTHMILVNDRGMGTHGGTEHRYLQEWVWVTLLTPSQNPYP